MCSDLFESAPKTNANEPRAESSILAGNFVQRSAMLSLFCLVWKRIAKRPDSFAVRPFFWVKQSGLWVVECSPGGILVLRIATVATAIKASLV